MSDGKKHGKQELNPLTGAYGGSCRLFQIVDSEDAPKFTRTEIFDKVFGAMEQLRIEENERCREKRKERGWGGFFNPASRKHPADLHFTTLRSYFYSQCRNLNWVFPLDCGQFFTRKHST